MPYGPCRQRPSAPARRSSTHPTHSHRGTRHTRAYTASQSLRQAGSRSVWALRLPAAAPCSAGLPRLLTPADACHLPSSLPPAALAAARCRRHLEAYEGTRDTADLEHILDIFRSWVGGLPAGGQAPGWLGGQLGGGGQSAPCLPPLLSGLPLPCCPSCPSCPRLPCHLLCTSNAGRQPEPHAASEARERAGAVCHRRRRAPGHLGAHGGGAGAHPRAARHAAPAVALLCRADAGAAVRAHGRGACVGGGEGRGGESSGPPAGHAPAGCACDTLSRRARRAGGWLRVAWWRA